MDVSGLQPSIGQRQTWGLQLKDARELAGITIKEIAESLNLRVSFVDAIENGSGNVHMEWSYERQHLRAIAKKIGVSLNEDMPL